MLNIKGKFIQHGKFKAVCPKCGKKIIKKNDGEIKEIKCECGYLFVKVGQK